jgi:hypothetical protein
MSRPGFTMFAEKKDGKTTFDRERFKRLWDRLPDGKYDLTAEKHTHSRSLQQNKAYWALIVKPCSDSSGYEEDDVHEILKQRCNPKFVSVLNTDTGEIEEMKIGGSTTTLNVEEFSAYYKRCQQFAAETWDCYCPDPNEEGQFSEKKSA